VTDKRKLYSTHPCVEARRDDPLEVRARLRPLLGLSDEAVGGVAAADQPQPGAGAELAQGCHAVVVVGLDCETWDQSIVIFFVPLFTHAGYL